MSAVGQVEIADAVATEKLPNLHQAVALLQKLLSEKQTKKPVESQFIGDFILRKNVQKRGFYKRTLVHPSPGIAARVSPPHCSRVPQLSA